MTNVNNIRFALFSDSMRIYEVIKSNPQEVLPRPLPDIMLNFDRFMVYESDDEIKGVISWRVLPILDIINPDFCLEIVSFSVMDEFKKQGIGTALLKKILEYLKKFSPDRIIVLTFYPEFFQKLGFKEISKKELYPKIYLGCIDCTKYPSPLTCPEAAMEYRY